MISAFIFTGFLFVTKPAFAVSPAAVTNIQSSYEDGNILLQWDAVSNADHYRIYFSSRSILDNGGEYDDFEETDGAVTNHALTSKPDFSRIYFAILAVNANGEESPVFLEETSLLLSESNISPENVILQDVDVSSLQNKSSSISNEEVFTITGPSETKSSQSSAYNFTTVPYWQQADSGGTFHLLLAESLNKNEVLLHFNTAPYIEPSRAPEAFHIVDSDGNKLRISSIFIFEDTITVRTENQKKDTVYQVKLSEPLMSTTGEPLDEINRKILFRGHANGDLNTFAQFSSSSPIINGLPASSNISDTSAQLCSAELSFPLPVHNLHLNAIEQGDGTFIVQARWMLDTGVCQSPSKYAVRQSIDGGRSYSNPEVLPIEIGGIDIPGVYSQKYAFGISVISSYGEQSREVFDMIELPIIVSNVISVQNQNNNQSRSSVSSSPAAMPTQIEKPLAQTGTKGLIFGILVSAISAGTVLWCVRRKQAN